MNSVILLFLGASCKSLYEMNKMGNLFIENALHEKPGKSSSGGEPLSIAWS